MPLFRKTPGQVPPPSIPPVVDLMAGQSMGYAFGSAIRRGEIPPSAFLWINRYANENPGMRVETTTEEWSRYTPEVAARQRVGLADLLRLFQERGAVTLPEILAAEECVTVTLTLETVRVAHLIVDGASGEARDKWQLGVEPDPDWRPSVYIEGQDNVEVLVCEAIRTGMRAQVEAALTLASFRGADEVANRRPDQVVEFTLMEFDRIAGELRDRFEDGLPTS